MEGERKRYGGSGAVRVGKTKKACVFRERERKKKEERECMQSNRCIKCMHDT